MRGPKDLTRSSTPLPNISATLSTDGANLRMPFFLFNAHGMLEIPPLFGERYHHIGVVEAAYQEGEVTFAGAPDRVHLGWRHIRRPQGASCLLSSRSIPSRAGPFRS